MSSVEENRQRLEAVYAAIQELDDDLAANRLSAADHAELKRRSERQAAALLKRLREAGQQPGRRQAARDAVTLGARLRSPMGLGVGAIVLLLLGLTLGVFLGRSAVNEPPAPRPTVSTRPAGVSAALEALSKEVESESAPVPKLLAFAHLALDEGRVPAAIWAYQRVLARDSRNAEALTHMGLILYQGGHVDEGLGRVEEALRVNPKYAHAHWDRAQMLWGKQDYAGTAGALEAFLALVPTGEDATRARAMLAEARGRASPGGRPGAAPPSTPAAREGRPK